MPHVMERVLQLALRFDIEPVFTRQFLAKKFNKGVDRKGETIPLLNIKLLSGLTLNSDNDRQLNVQELTDYEQQLINSIIVCPGLQIPDTTVSLQLWPDKNQLKQRSSLDTLVFRLRKKLNDIVQPAKSMEYLIVEHGHVKLVNCRVDVLQFLEYCKEARLHDKKGELWQAHNNFFSAFSLWEDSGINKLNLGENVIFQEAVEQEFLNSSKIWASILINHERTNKATQVLETAFRHFPQDTELARQIYDLYARAGNFGKAQNVIRMYKNEHTKIAETPLEVEEALASFWNNSLN
jgi:DNA-binding SARP family transcriptional activator